METYKIYISQKARESMEPVRREKIGRCLAVV